MQQVQAGQRNPAVNYVYGDDYNNALAKITSLKEQFLEFISLVMQDDAERKRQQLRQQKKALTAELQRNSDGMRRNGHQEADVDYTGS